MEETHICEKCEKSFSSERYLKQHNNSNSCQKIHDCHKCSKEFSSAANLRAHLRRKNPCVPDKVPVINITSDENKCIYCGKTFATNFNLRRHTVTCPMKNNQSFLINLVESQQQQINQLIEVVSKNNTSVTVNNVQNSNNVQNNVQQNNNIYVNVSIVPFGEEDYSKLDHAKVLELIKGNAADFIPQMIEHIYADPKKPAYHNIFYDKQSKSIIKYASISADVKTWVKTDARTVSSQISSRLTKFIHPLNSPYFNDVLKTNDTETANKIIDLSNSKEDPFEKNIESLSIITKNPHFTDQVKVQELTETEGV